MLSELFVLFIIFKAIHKFNNITLFYRYGFPGGSDDEESAWNAGDPGSIPGLGRSAEEGNGYHTKGEWEDKLGVWD